MDYKQKKGVYERGRKKVFTRYNFYIHTPSYDFLVKLGGTVSEHIRRAIDDYIEKKKREELNVSISPSTKGGQYGKKTEKA